MFIKLPDLNVNVRIDGPPGAPVLLLLHSLGTSSDIWDGLIGGLSRRYRVIRPDMRGHGLTSVSPGPYTIEGLAGDAFALMDALSIEHAHVAGVSIGGLIAQSMALSGPERVLSLTLIDTAAVFPTSSSWNERAATVRSGGLLDMGDAVMSRWVTPACMDMPAALGLRQIFLRTDPEGYAAACEALAQCDLSKDIGNIRQPTLVLVGEDDPSTPVSVARDLAGTIPSARMTVIPQASHIPTVEQPEAIAEALLTFLAGEPEDSHPPDLYSRGMDVRRAVLGAEHVARSTERMTDFDQYFQTFITRTAWGQVWSRPNFDRRTRSVITLALLAALGCEEEFALHVRASRNTGCSPEDIAELLLHVAVYAGIPRANSAIRCAKEILADNHSKK
ncbi:bifunctional 3-oxoadipate enol-lactonase/4-carboxymuconolactone decarboxylase PcaDC [Acetobacter fallax]|uniref:4-carboxymuconolactone decarboxylase n=1 Tax=Acetobacter fallax TaxID=1737473 RepID=A0ABX0KD63_9PROT|nr:4-carboxymuconolactone decarboxylase [Acetobacter fallax]NHO33404.1 4-carboxymuconolactone decarboxylase [Acetobacter fallax]NHO37023.1 4-carboxymuconolactone decarboxylase [Acetobacter fallax]